MSDKVSMLRAARAICAMRNGGFCEMVGGELGCKAGRGAPRDGSQCVAREDQLLLGGELDLAEAAVRAYSFVPD